MKNKGILLFILGILLMLPIAVFGANANVSTDFEGVVTAKPGDVVAYDIEITTDELIPQEYKAELVYDDKVLELKTVTPKLEGWSSKGSGKSILLSNKDEELTGTVIVATVTFKVKADVPKQNTEIKLTNIQITTVDENEIDNITVLDDKKVTLSIKSTDNTLKDLKVDGITLEDFKSDVYEYELTVDSDIETIDVKATVNNANATFVDSFGSREVTLNYGENEVLVKVKSESGEVLVYKITIIREDDRNTNNKLKEVIINSGKIKLDLVKNEVDYVIKTYKLKELEVEAIAVDSKAIVKVEIPEEIVVGDNVVVISVTSESGEERLYTITFENSDTTIDTKIKTLYVKNYELDFDKNTMVYEVVFNKKFKNGLDIKIVTVSSDDIVSYEIYYNGTRVTEDTKINLKPGDKYEIKVMPVGLEEGIESDTNVYTINIVKDTRISFFLVLEVFILAVLFILIIVQVVKRNKIRKTKKELATKKAKSNTKTEETKTPVKSVQKEIDKTKVISDEELEKMNNNDKE